MSVGTAQVPVPASSVHLQLCWCESAQTAAAWKSTKAAPCKESSAARNRARNRNIDLSKIAVIINAKLVIKDLSKWSVLRQGNV